MSSHPALPSPSPFASRARAPLPFTACSTASIALAVTAACGAVAMLLAAAAPVTAAEPATAASSSAQVKRGQYLVTTSACHDCHTPLKAGPDGPEPDMSRMLSGHPESLVMPPAPQLPEGPWVMTAAATTTAWAGPWGVSFTANLTPDEETGLGRWTLRHFKDTIRTGRHMGKGRPILPPMPIPMYRHFSDADLEAIYAYLRSIPPVRNRVPEPLPPATRTADAMQK